ncbi:hypothetical protein FQN60_013954 [Etheostoma spectabile]|uniref:Uncharacterized protein n=1 Tax=Etheostoma spectabile TaxID=54343 RepID=A0A5J5CKB4_9PERO|nr:hypothetical protein FQN60_013954 [Etheostoma spectabile]
MWLLTSPINKIRLSLGGGRREQLVIVLVGAEGAGVVPLASVHDGVGHHDVAQRVVQVAVQQAALVLGRRHIVLGKGGGRAQSRSHTHGHAHAHAHAHAHHGGALLLDHALVHGLVELLGAALCPLRVVPVYAIDACPLQIQNKLDHFRTAGRQRLAQRGVLMTACRSPPASASLGWVTNSPFIHTQNMALHSISLLAVALQGEGGIMWLGRRENEVRRGEAWDGSLMRTGGKRAVIGASDEDQRVDSPGPGSFASRGPAGSSPSWWGRGCLGACRATA